MSHPAEEEFVEEGYLYTGQPDFDKPQHVDGAQDDLDDEEDES